MGKYISRDEAINTIKSLESNMPAKDNYAKGYDAALGRALIAVREVPPVTDVQPVNQWISVKDRLPDESCECLGVVDGEVTEVSYNPKQKGLICVWSMCDAYGFKPLSGDAITHWMPMPEPPVVQE